MFVVEFGGEKKQRTLTLRLRGHAGASEPGRDIVCAAASILTYTTAQCAEFMDIMHKLAESPQIRMSEGDAEISLTAKDSAAYAIARQMMFVIKIGFALLANKYPQYVRMQGAEPLAI